SIRSGPSGVTRSTVIRAPKHPVLRTSSPPCFAQSSTQRPRSPGQSAARAAVLQQTPAASAHAPSRLAPASRVEVNGARGIGRHPRLPSGCGRALEEMRAFPHGGPPAEGLEHVRVALLELREEVILDALVDRADLALARAPVDRALRRVAVLGLHAAV